MYVHPLIREQPARDRQRDLRRDGAGELAALAKARHGDGHASDSLVARLTARLQIVVRRYRLSPSRLATPR
jgi:hypothetical protein